jgi:hypothetical protein
VLASAGVCSTAVAAGFSAAQPLSTSLPNKLYFSWLKTWLLSLVRDFTAQPRGTTWREVVVDRHCLETMQMNSSEQAELMQKWLYIESWPVTSWPVAHWSSHHFPGPARWNGISSKELQSALIGMKTTHVFLKAILLLPFLSFPKREDEYRSFQTASLVSMSMTGQKP